MSAAATARTKRHAKADKPTPAETVRKHQQVLARAKKLYDRADVILAELMAPFLEECKECGAKKLKQGTIVKGKHVAHVELTADGKAAILLDNFAGSDVVWGHGGVRHYGLKVIDV